MSDKVRQLSQRDWDQLVVVAAGFLPLTNGDLTAAMARALAAHAELIDNVRRGVVGAELPKGRVRLVYEQGNLNVVYEKREQTDEGARARGEPSMPLLSLDIDTEPRR
jgi:hypothetical protein